MKFNIICSFCGFYKDKAAVSQGTQVRLFRFYGDVIEDLKKSTGLVKSMECRIDDDGEIWIREVNYFEPEK